MFSLFKIISEIFFPLIADRSFGEFWDFKPFTQAFKTLWGLAEPNDLATTSWIPRTSQTDLIAPPAIIPVPAGAALMKEGYNDEEGNEFIALTLMVKQDGFAPDNNNWFWASYDAAGNVNQSGVVEMCISCHATSDSDYVLFVEEE